MDNKLLEILVEIYIQNLDEIVINLQNANEQEKDFLRGQIMGYYSALEAMKVHADILEVSIAELENVDIFKYLTY